MKTSDSAPLPIDVSRSLAPRGLATLALLKARYDERKDHLSFFEPFVTHSVAAVVGDHCVAGDVRSEIQRRFGLTIPINTVQSLLGRLVKHGLLRREGGVFLKVTGIELDPGIDIAWKAAEEEQLALAEALLDYARERGHAFTDRHDALAALYGFVADHNVPLLLGETQNIRGFLEGERPTRGDRVIAAFIQQKCIASKELSSALSRLLEGFVTQNALLMADVSTSEQKFQNLFLLLDAPIVLALLGVLGNAAALAASEALSILKATGAVPQVLDKTLAEVRRILAVYEDCLGTTEGQLRLFETDLTRFFLVQRWTPADVRMLSASLELRMSTHGIGVRLAPKRDRRFTLDEVALSVSLSRDKRTPSNEPRVLHDIDCVAAILTLRAGSVASAVERCRALFLTTSGSVIRTVQGWYKAQGQSGIPPIIHQVALTNIAWLKRPASASRLKLYEIAALCATLLRPSRRTWDAFLRHLRQLRSDGVISSEEAVAIVASEMTEPLLTAIDDETDPDSESLTDVIERVRASYKAQADETFTAERARAQADITMAMARATEEEGRRRALESRIEVRALRIAHLMGRIFFGAMTVLVVLSVIVVLPGVFERVAGWVRALAWLAIAIGSMLAVYGLLSGGHILELRSRVERRIAAAVRSVTVGPDS